MARQYETKDDVHESKEKSIALNYDKYQVTETYEGGWQKCVEFVKDLKFGWMLGDESLNTSIEKLLQNTSAEITKQKGNSGLIRLRKTAYLPRARWEMNFHTLSKPIETLVFQDEITGGSDVNAMLQKLGPIINARALKIKAWSSFSSALAHQDDYFNKMYPEYYTEDGKDKFRIKALSGNDAKLADLILNEIRSYDRHYPILTAVRTRFSPFDFASEYGVDKLGCGGNIKDSDAYRFTVSADKPFVDSAASQMPVYVKTGDMVSQNMDGSVTRREMWTGMHAFDQDLYSDRSTFEHEYDEREFEKMVEEKEKEEKKKG